MTEQLRQLTKLLYGFKTEKLKNTVLDGQVSLFENDLSFTDSEQTDDCCTKH
ncbi:hypothetical protein [Bacillus cereus]|uniref:hypothetical protein n=1 Tax=Bacillus cereus TaxID=1396 RepID=UPI003B00CC1A